MKRLPISAKWWISPSEKAASCNANSNDWRLHLVIDVARKGTILEYLPHLSSNSLYVNETYPEPQGSDLEALKATGARVFHIAGVRGAALPAFPLGYRDAIPCCAMHRPDRAEPVVQKLA